MGYVKRFDDENETDNESHTEIRALAAGFSRLSSTTKAGWIIALSPLWFLALLLSSAFAGGGLSWLGLAIITLVSAAILYSATKFDLRELIRRGFSISLSPRLIWRSPLVFLIIRGRETRQDFQSYNLAWAHSISFVAAAVLAVVIPSVVAQAIRLLNIY